MARPPAAIPPAAAAIVALFVFGSLSTHFRAVAAPRASAGPASEKAFDSYRTALASLPRPANMEFEYTVTRSGPNRIVTEQHRVYWTSAGQERNDTIAVNGTPVVPAVSQLLHRTTWPYDVGQFAVSTDEYDMIATGVAVVAGQKVHGFTLTRKAPADFKLKSLYVDAKRRLPVREAFSVAGSDCAGGGVIDFAAAGAYWLPNFVSVVCAAGGLGGSPAAIFKESIRFNSYHFPAEIPPDVFKIASSSQGSGAVPASP